MEVTANFIAQTVIGNPLNEKVRMGSLGCESQRKEVKEQVAKIVGFITNSYMVH
jgi:oxepin-CoA hydrolase/3-oxo-5,6-dehydrosuberyl-CoA semialdehyde dehydrogenase